MNAILKQFSLIGFLYLQVETHPPGHTPDHQKHDMLNRPQFDREIQSSASNLKILELFEASHLKISKPCLIVATYQLR